MKKLILILISVILVISMCSCDGLSFGGIGDSGNKDDSGNNSGNNESKKIMITELPTSDDGYERCWELTDAPNGYITFREFCEALKVNGYMENADPSVGEWMVNSDTNVSDDTPLKKGSVVKYRESAPDVTEYIKIVVKLVSLTGETRTQEISVDKDGITLGELCENNLETTYEDTLSMGEWTLAGKPIGKDYVLRDGDKIVLTQTESGDNNNPGGDNNNPGGDDNNNPGGDDNNNPGGDNNNPGGGDNNQDDDQGGSTDSDKKFKAKVIIHASNGDFQTVYEFKGESVTVNYVSRIVLQRTYEETVDIGYWTVNGMRADGTSLITAGAVVEFTPYNNPGQGGNDNPGQGGTDNPGQGGTDNPGQGGTDDPGQGGTDDPGQGGTDDPDTKATIITVVLDFGDGKPLKNEFEFAETDLTLDYVCHEVTGMSYEETALLGEWFVDGIKADGSTPVRDGVAVEFMAYGQGSQPGEGECEHDWNGGYCPKCDTSCSHMEWDDRGNCTVCGMPLGVGIPTVNYEITIDDASVGGGEIEGTAVRLEDVLLDFFGTEWYSMADVYAVYVNGEPANMDTTVYGGSWIALVSVNSGVEEYKEFFLHGTYYPDMPYENEMGEIPFDWYMYNCKQFEYYYSGTEGGLSLGMMLDGSMGLGSCEDAYNVFLNGKQVTDIYNIFVTDTAYVVILPKAMVYPEYTVTVQDSVLGTTTEYKYDLPVYSWQIREELFGDRDLEGLQITVGYDSWDPSINGSGAYIAVDTTVYVRERTTTVCFEIVEGGGKTEYTVKGVVPSLGEFLKEYAGISDPENYMFVNGDWDVTEELSLDDTCPYYIIAIPAKLIAEDGFDVEYEFTDEYGGHFEGVIHSDDPARMLAELFNYSGEEFGWIDFYVYKVTVDGQVVDTMEKGAYFTLLYKDCKVVITPANRLLVMLDNGSGEFLEKHLELDSKSITVGQIFEMLGLKFADYTCRINGNWIMSADDSLEMYSYGRDMDYMEIVPCKISFAIGFIDGMGYYNEHVSEPFFDSVTAEELIAWFNYASGNEVNFEDYRITFYDDSNGEEKIAIDITDGKYTWSYVPNEYNMYEPGHRRYYVEVVSRKIFVEVNITDNADVYINQVLEYMDEVTVTQLLADFGYTWSDVDWAIDMNFATSIDEGYVITMNTRIEIYLKH